MNDFAEGGQFECMIAPRQRERGTEILTPEIWNFIDSTRSISCAALGDKRLVLRPKKELGENAPTVTPKTNNDDVLEIPVTILETDEESSTTRATDEQTDDDETRPEEINRTEED